MGQYTPFSRFALGSLLWTLVLASLALTAGCGKATPSATTTAPSQKTAPTVASVVPAATDIIMQMNATDHLVGVSNYEPKTPVLASFDRVGDYNGVDWEKLTQIRPGVLVVQRPKKEIAQIFQDRAAALHIELVDIHMDRLDEIEPMIRRIGDALHEPQKAQAMIGQLNDQLSRATLQAKAGQPVRTLIVLDKDASFIVGGRQNFLDSLLTLAGGSNAAGSMDKDYPTIDREKLLQLDPDAIIQLLPDAPPQLVTAARESWNSMPELKAVRTHRVYIHTEWFLQLPSGRVGEVALLMANDLHPLTANAPATTTSSR